jgi:hypothetical protein
MAPSCPTLIILGLSFSVPPVFDDTLSVFLNEGPPSYWESSVITDSTKGEPGYQHLRNYRPHKTERKYSTKQADCTKMLIVRHPKGFVRASKFKHVPRTENHRLITHMSANSGYLRRYDQPS